jgi:hypothetical protein
MDCRDCPCHQEETAKCRDGKLNPQTWEQAVSVSQVFGLRAICVFNDYRERLVAARTPGPSVVPGGRSGPSTPGYPRRVRGR